MGDETLNILKELSANIESLKKKDTLWYKHPLITPVVMLFITAFFFNISGWAEQPSKNAKAIEINAQAIKDNKRERTIIINEINTAFIITNKNNIAIRDRILNKPDLIELPLIHK